MKREVICNKCGPIGTANSQFSRVQLKDDHLRIAHFDAYEQLQRAYNHWQEIVELTHREYWKPC